MTSQSLGEVVESQDGRFSPGDLVGQLGWQEYAVAREEQYGRCRSSWIRRRSRSMWSG